MTSSSAGPVVEQALEAALWPGLPKQQMRGEMPRPGLGGASYGPEPALLRLEGATANFNPTDSIGAFASDFDDHMSFESNLDFSFASNCQRHTPLFTAGGCDMFGMNLESSVDEFWLPTTANASPLGTSLTRRASPTSPIQSFPDDHYFSGLNTELAQLEDYVSPPAATMSSLSNLSGLFTSAKLPAQNGTPGGGMFDLWLPATGTVGTGRVILPAGSTEQWMRALPFSKFEAYMHSQNIISNKSGSSTQQQLGVSFSGGFAIRLFANSPHSGSRAIVQHLPDGQTPLQKLGKLLPGESTAIMSEQQMTETRFVRILLFSMMNGFAGLNHIPIEDILKSMGHFNTSKLLLQILEEGPPFTSRTLGDNMFRAAIEAKDQRIVQVLLKRKLVNVNDTVCFFRNKRYTPVERAASLQALGLIRTLAEAGADVNKTHGDEQPPGALRKLFQAAAGPQGYGRDPATPPATATPELIDTLNFLIQKGAKVDLDLLRGHLISFTNKNEVACLISRNIPLEDHQGFFKYDDEDDRRARHVCLVIRTAEELDDSTAVTIIQNMIELCERAGCSKCLRTQPKAIEEAATEGAKRGHIKLVQLLVDHVQSTARILSGAIRSGNNTLIRLVLGSCTKPELDPQAHVLGRYTLGPRATRQEIYNMLPTTPLAEAVRTGDTDLIKVLEDSGARKNLTTGGRLEALIFAAAGAGNMPYMDYLLKIACSSSQKYRPHCLAVSIALENGHDEVAKILLLAGAEVSSQRSSWERLIPTAAPHYYINALGAALLQKRDPALVRAILSADIDQLCENDMKDVAGWFDTSIISVLVSIFPDLVSSSPILLSALGKICKRCMETDNVAFFKIFMESISLSRTWLDSCLAIATGVGHAEMVDLLLQMGANPFEGSVLKAAIPKHTEMLQILFGEDRKQQTSRKCVGAHVLKFIMAECPGNAEVLNGLLDRRLVHLAVPEILVSYGVSGYTGEMLTPLGLAIAGAPGYCETNLVAANQLLGAGSDPNGIARILTMGGRVSETALMLAIKTGREDVVQLLLKYNADVNKKPFLSTKRTPLQCAAELGNLDIVRLLLRHGADVNEEPAIRSGGTALQFAAISGNCNVAAELLEREALLDALPSKVNGRWPLEGASEHGRLDMIEFLWRAKGISFGGAGFERRQCLRSMDFARSNGHLGCRDLIAKLSGISVDRLDSEDYGAPWLAY